MEEAQYRITKWKQKRNNTKILDLSLLNLSDLPPLPNSLQKLDCSHNKLTKLPPLPNNLQDLDCSENQLTILPPLPNTLIELDCSQNQLTALPPLPDTLKYLYCKGNFFTALPSLPPNLQEYDCALDDEDEDEIQIYNRLSYLALTEYLLDNDIPDYLISHYFNDNNVKNNMMKWFVKYVQTPIPTPQRKAIEKKSWHSVCNTPFDIISQTQWEDSDADNADIIFIKWGNNTECYDANTIKNVIKQLDSIATEWVKNPLASKNIPQNELKQGVGFIPGKGELYVKLWPHNVHVPLESIKQLFYTDNRYFKAKSIGKKRLGNIKGTRGVSELHGQEPFEEIYEIIY